MKMKIIIIMKKIWKYEMKIIVMNNDNEKRNEIKQIMKNKWKWNINERNNNENNNNNQ